ncbi:helix-turn-helix domain-containing protein [Microbacterium sp. NPDC089696]|uniref:helix-turn-helix domain-containing protein n=1 Tax=Microbacterium sp. NPDC089696 TaxID=3364199 RepID=UPI00380F49FF
MTETDQAAQWGEWLHQMLDERGWRQADLVRESNGLIKRDRASKWVNGNERPSHRLAIVAANTLGVTQESALTAAGYSPTVESLVADREALVAEYEVRMRRLRELDQKVDLSSVSSADLLGELARRLNVAEEPDVPALDENASQWALVARPRSKDRGEDLT